MRWMIWTALSLAACSGAPAATEPRQPTEPPPAEVAAPSAVAEGYGGVRFEAFEETDRIERVSDAERATLASGIGGPRAMVRVGGTLFVGTRDGAIRTVGLADGSTETIAEGLGPVAGLALDHVGYLAVASEARGLLRVAPQGEVTALSPDEGAGALSFDPETRRLTVGGDGAARELDYLALTGEDPEVWAARDARPMRPFVLRGIELTGAEYWPYRGDAEPDYPADVLWGFYPEEGVVFEGEPAPASATEAALACAQRSYDALRAWIEGATEDQLARLHEGAPRFYLWVNDYSTASDPFPHEVRPARFWFWRRDPAVEGRVPGYWKWETTLDQDGVCHVPEAEQIEHYLAEWEPE